MTDNLTKKREHINADGEFQSDKYPWCLPGFVPLKLTDADARLVLSQYVSMRRGIDPEFADDLRFAICRAREAAND